jgi:hypothetical protein
MQLKASVPISITHPDALYFLRKYQHELSGRGTINRMWAKRALTQLEILIQNYIKLGIKI